MRAFLFALALALGAQPALAQLFGKQELLDPDNAFRVSARALDEELVEVTFKIADGYYMYRERFSFATADGKPLSGAEIPRGTIKDDALFGKVETFRDFVRMRVPVSAAEAKQGNLTLSVTSQGCSDQGVCYLPQTRRVKVELPRR